MSDYRKGYLDMLNANCSISEVNLLSIMLGNAFGGKDFSDISKALLNRFPSIKSLLEADTAEIMAVDGVPEKIAVYFKTVGMISDFTPREEIVIKDTNQFLEVIKKRFGEKENENVEIYFLNKRNKVTDVKCYTTNNADRVDVSATDILAVIANSQAYGIYFAHNHVNCPATPSAADDLVTKKLIAACKACNIVFYDHCIISSTGDKFSYRLSGKYDQLVKELELKGKI